MIFSTTLSLLYVSLRAQSLVPPTGSGATDRLRIDVLTDLNDVREVWPSTCDAKNGLCHVFQCADILDVWLETIGAARGIEPAFVVISDEAGRPVMLLPLGIETRMGTRVLTFLDLHVADYNVPVLFPWTPDWSRRELHSLWDRVLAALPAVDLMQLEKMPAEVGGKPNPLMHLGTRPWPVSCHIANLGPSWDDFARDRIRPQSRHVRNYRQLERKAPVTYTLARTEEEARGLFDVLMAQKSRRFADTNVPGFDKHPGMECFYRKVTERLFRHGTVIVAAVRSGEDIIATQWGLRHGHRYYYLIPGFEAGRWKKYSPGRILNEGTLRWCLDQRLAADFGIGDEPYKLEYCEEHVELHEVECALNARAQAHLVGHRVRQRMRETTIWQAARPYKWVLRRSLMRKH